jgi:hypothetical protein
LNEDWAVLEKTNLPGAVVAVAFFVAATLDRLLVEAKELAQQSMEP